jgi:hypothetical protein
MSDLGVKKRVMVHTVVLTIFFSPRISEMVACHNDGNPANNNISNLRWDTIKANIEDERRHGTLAVGQRNWNSILSESEVVNVRSLAIKGTPTRSIANMFHVDVGTVRRIVTRKALVHV